MKPGEAKVSSRLYNHYANQLLNAEKEGVEIHVSVGRHDLPADLETQHLGSPRDFNSQVLSAASVFKSLIAGLPGGILGSPALYHALVDIYHARLTREQVRPFKGTIGGASSTASAGAKLISLAILALTSPMQLDFICAVLGLCHLLIHETQRAADLKRQGLGISLSRFRFVYGALDQDRLAYILGPLLTNGWSDAEDDPVGVINREIESRQVATLLISYWPFVVRQLRGWGGSRYPLRCVKVPSFSRLQMAGSKDEDKA